MNATATTPRRTTLNLIGAGIVAAALGLGALFGTVTSPDSPAHADPAEKRPTCQMVCADSATSGRGGEVPNPLNGVKKASGGNVAGSR